MHFDPGHPDAKLAPYCLGARCNKAIAQNLERYHKVALKRRADKDKEKSGEGAEDGDEGTGLEGEGDSPAEGKKAVGHLSIEGLREAELDGTRVVGKAIKPGEGL